MAGTIRIEILPVALEPVLPGAVSDALLTGGGADSARARVGLSVVTGLTLRFIGVWPCLSRKVGDAGDVGGGSVLGLLAGAIQ